AAAGKAAAGAAHPRAAAAPGKGHGPAAAETHGGAPAGAGAEGAAETAAEGPSGAGPESDPGFAQMQSRAHGAAAATKAHRPAAEKVAEAHGAAVPPANDVASQAAGAQVGKMSAAPPGAFDKKAFMDAVRKAIEAAAPKNLEEADDFKGSGKAGQVKGQVSGLVGADKQAAEGEIKQATTAPP